MTRKTVYVLMLSLLRLRLSFVCERIVNEWCAKRVCVHTARAADEVEQQPISTRSSDMSKSKLSGSRAVRRSVQALIVACMPVFAWAGPVDINKADAKTIAKELDGVGLSRAQAIVEYREKNGAFKSVEDLKKVKGIGAKTLEQNRTNIRFDGAETKKAS
jgi:competence protein ComEA